LAYPEAAQALCSPLLSDDEIGELAGLAITFRANQNGGAHAAGCRYISAKAADAETMTIAAFRAADPGRRPCRACGGGIMEPLSAEQREQVQALILVWQARLERERQDEEARFRLLAQVRRADVIDERARRIIDGWDWYLDREREAAAGFPDSVLSSAVTCPDCGAEAAVTFGPRTLRVLFTCPQDAGHGYLRLPGEDREPLAAWGRGGREYVAIALVAQVLAGGDNTWSRVYGTRAEDYRATAGALAAFDAANPEPMRLAPDVRCGDCGNTMNVHAPVDLGRGDREEAIYDCGIRHEDGRYRHYNKDGVDTAIDRELVRLLRRHPSWAAAPEIAPSPAALAQYADYLTKKIAIYDTHIGAARDDPGLSRQRARLDDTLRQVTAIREQGALAVAGLTGHQAGRWYLGVQGTFTDLARALLTARVEVSQSGITVFTPFDSGTPLYRTLRTREIREELADLQRRQQELTEELAGLERHQQATDPAGPDRAGALRAEP
jgi:hypothetical protein